MEMMKKMMDCMGSMGKEEKEKMMEKCFAHVKEQCEAEEDSSDKNGSDETACCPDMSKFTSCCPDMMEKFKGQMGG